MCPDSDIHLLCLLLSVISRAIIWLDLQVCELVFEIFPLQFTGMIAQLHSTLRLNPSTQ